MKGAPRPIPIPKARPTHTDELSDTTYADILFKYVDRLSDPTPEDPLDMIVAQMLAEVAEELSVHFAHYSNLRKAR
jgi:hypothetical protein